MQETNIAVIRRPEVMRWAVIIALVGTGALCGLAALSQATTAIGPALVAALLCGGALWLAQKVFRTDAGAVMFDGERIYDDADTVLCHLDDVVDIERGFALFKPSGGFVLVLKSEVARGWSPGLWWRMGRRVGIGGATSSRACKHMADAITGALATRAVASVTTPPR